MGLVTFPLLFYCPARQKTEKKKLNSQIIEARRYLPGQPKKIKDCDNLEQ